MKASEAANREVDGESGHNLCLYHSEIAYRVERLGVRMDRIELGIVSVLFVLIAQLWMLWDLPSKIQTDRLVDAPKTASIFPDILDGAQAHEDKK